MAIFPFYSQRKPRGFQYTSIYTDERKEELKRKVESARREINGESNLTGEDVKDHLRGAFHSQSKTLKGRKSRPGSHSNAASSNWKLLIAIAVLAALVWFLYFR